MMKPAAVLLLLAQGAWSEDNGLSKTPPMGWNPWNCYANVGDGVTEEIVLAAARAMAARLKPAGWWLVAVALTDGGWGPAALAQR